MTTTEAYVVTDLHPPTKPARRIPWDAIRRFAKADMVALWMVTRFTARHLGRILNSPCRSDGMPLWWALLWGGLGLWAFLAFASWAIEHPEAFTCPTVHNSQEATQHAPRGC